MSRLNWTHLDFSVEEDRQQVRCDDAIPSIAADALLADDSRPRATQFEEGLLVILRGVNLNPGAEIEDMVSIRLWIEPDRVVSTGRRRLRSLEETIAELDSGMAAQTSGKFVARLVERLGDFIGDSVEQIENTLEVSEDQVNDYSHIVRNSPFSLLRRQTARIRRYIAPQKEALERLSRFQSPAISDDDRAAFYEQANRLTLILEDLDLVRERALVAQEEFMGMLAHEQNTRMLLLSVVAAIFLPLSFLTGLMGMNVAGLPGLVNPAAFWILLGLMVILAAGILWLFKFRRWL